MSTIVTRAGKGSPLTNTEVDNNFTNLNTDKVEKSGSTLTGDLAFGDNVKAKFGASDDLQIYHDGSHSYIKEVGTGNLRFDADNWYVRSADGSEAKIAAITNGAVSLYYDGTVKLATTSSGVDITGDLVADGLTVENSGTIELEGALSKLLFTRIDTTTIGGNPLGSIEFAHQDADDAGTAAKIIGEGDGTTGQGRLVFYTGTPSNLKKNMLLNSSGDVFFYEDTGNTQKLTWDASAEELQFKDNVKAEFGDGGDLQIYHNGTNSRIDVNGGNDLQIVQNVNDQDIILYADDGLGGVASYFKAEGLTGEAILYHYGSQKFATKSTGIDVTGTVTADSLTVDGGGGSASIVAESTTGYATATLKADTSNSGSGGTPELRFELGGTQKARFRVDTSDNVEIATGTTQGTKRFRVASNGDVSLFDSTGTSQDFYWDASTSRLGIGTTSPSAKLHVYGSSLFRGSTNSASTEYTSLGVINGWSSNGVTAAKIGFETGSDIHKSEITFNTANSYNALTERMRITSDGRLGIGTTSPSNALHVYHATTNHVAMFESGDFTSEISIKDNTASSYITNEAGKLKLRADVNGEGASSRIQFDVDGSERMRIDSSGNVGIGTTSPSAQLHISTDTNNSTSAHLDSSQTAIITNSNASGTARLKFLGTASESGSITFGGGVGAASDTFKIYPRYLNGTPAVTVNGSGNVGIGTTSPSYPFHISSADNMIAKFESTDSTVGLDLADDTGFTRITSTAGALRIDTNDDGAGASNEFVIAQEGTERMRIDSSGNLLVGKTSTSSSTVGFEARSDGFSAATRDGNTPQIINRLTSDGTLVDLRKDGSTVGVIGTASGNTYFASSLKGIRFRANDMLPVNASDGSAVDAQIDLGISSVRWRNLYLSGDVISDGSVFSNVSINAQTGTTYTTVLADRSKLVTLDNASAITVTIPPNSSVAYPTGTKIDLLAKGAGQVTVAAGTGVTVNSAQTLKLRAQWSAASVVKLATDTWVLLGDLEAV